MPRNAVLVTAGDHIVDFNISLAVTSWFLSTSSNLCYEVQPLFLFSKYPGVVYNIYNVYHYF